MPLQAMLTERFSRRLQGLLLLLLLTLEAALAKQAWGWMHGLLLNLEAVLTKHASCWLHGLLLLALDAILTKHASGWLHGLRLLTLDATRHGSCRLYRLTEQASGWLHGLLQLILWLRGAAEERHTASRPGPTKATAASRRGPAKAAAARTLNHAATCNAIGRRRGADRTLWRRAADGGVQGHAGCAGARDPFKEGEVVFVGEVVDAFETAKHYRGWSAREGL